MPHKPRRAHVAHGREIEPMTCRIMRLAACHPSVATAGGNLHARPTDSSARYLMVWGDRSRRSEASTGPPALPPSAKAPRPSPKAVTLMRVKGLTASVRLCGPGSARRRMQGDPQAGTSAMALTGKFRHRKALWGKIVLQVEEVKPFWSRSKPGALKRRWRDATLMDFAVPEMRPLIDMGSKPRARPQSPSAPSKVSDPLRSERPQSVKRPPAAVPQTTAAGSTAHWRTAASNGVRSIWSSRLPARFEEDGEQDTSQPAGSSQVSSGCCIAVQTIAPLWKPPLGSRPAQPSSC